MPENLLTAAEVAQYLKIKIETVYNLIRKADLPAAKIGGQWRFRETELTRWVEAQMGLSNRLPPESNVSTLLGQAATQKSAHDDRDEGQ